MRRWAFCSIAARAITLRSRSSRDGFSFLCPNKETKQRKFAVCTFLPTSALFSAKQKELATLKQLFVFHAPKSTSASRLKSEAGPLCFFYATSLRSLGCDVFFFSLRSFFLSSRAERRISFTSTPRAKRCALRGGLLRPPWKSVKKNRVFSVKNEKLFERSEFFSFRKMR